MRGSARGFTLLEMMVASAISILVLAGALWSAAELQRRGTMEESLMDAQNALRIAREMLESEIQRAGSGMGSAPLVFGQRPTGVTDLRYAIVVGTSELFDGKGVFDADPSFAAPPTAYGTRISDAVQLWSWDTEAFDPANGTPVLTPLVICSADGSSTMVRSGDKLCVGYSAGDLTSRAVMVIKPSKRMACVMTVNTDAPSKAGNYVVLGVSAKWPGVGQTSITTGPCIASTGTITADYTNFWTFDQDNPIYVVPLRGVMFRINWASGGPVFERQEYVSNWTTTVTPAAPLPVWTKLSEDVDLIKLRMGVVNDIPNTTDPTQDVLWFPETTPSRPSVDSCPKGTGTACNTLVPVDPPGSWTSSPTEIDARDALMRRLRMVELRVTTRTTKPDPTIVVKMTGSYYTLDSEQNPIDGYKRRTSTLEVVPRNFDYAGVTQ